MENEPECIRVGAPYDEPAFEALCREMSIWGTAQAALCAVFWRKGGDLVAESIGAGGVSALMPAAPYDQTALELCAACGWKALIPGECCLSCEHQERRRVNDLQIAKALGSAVKDAP